MHTDNVLVIILGLDGPLVMLRTAVILLLSDYSNQHLKTPSNEIKFLTLLLRPYGVFFMLQDISLVKKEASIMAEHTRLGRAVYQ